MRGQFLVMLIILGFSALSWVFGKMKEKTEAEEARKRAQLHQERVQQPGSQQPQQAAPNLAAQRKQQLAQLRQERLAALRAEMQARLQSAQQSVQRTPGPGQIAPRPLRPATPVATPRQPVRPAVLIDPDDSVHTRVATMRKPPSVSHDQARLADLRTHTKHAEHLAPDAGESVVHRLVTDAEVTRVDRRTGSAFRLGRLNAQDLRKAIILSELLSPPVALRGEI
ncbi:MAG: hypothetical protein H6814_11455 [Phycisphaeraceae bacterium]|nr:hypothetical protein [Phycisphaeraceae bacterium]